MLTEEVASDDQLSLPGSALMHRGPGATLARIGRPVQLDFEGRTLGDPWYGVRQREYVVLRPGVQGASGGVGEV